MLLMAIFSVLMGLLPSYSMIGYFSTSLLIIVRIFQGMSVAGQFTTSVLFAIESAADHRKAYNAPKVNLAGAIGFLLGQIVCFAVRLSVKEDQLKIWGWRIPFLLGSVSLLAVYHLRYYGGEEVDHLAEFRTRTPIKDSFRPKNLRGLLAGILMPALVMTTFYIAFSWLSTYMSDLLKPPVEQTYSIIIGAYLVSNVVLLPFLGRVADTYNRYYLMITCATISIFFFPIVMSVFGGTRYFLTYFLLITIWGMITNLYLFSLFVWLADIFPVESRVTSYSVSYNISAALFGGMIDATATWFYTIGGDLAVGLVLAFSAVLALIGITISPSPQDQRNRIQEGNDLGQLLL